MGDFGGAFAGAGVQAAGAVSAQRLNIKATRHARRWQEMMASTAYQRTVKDLQAAGLNPALAFGGGSANPSNVPQTQVPHFENIGAGMADAFSTGARQASTLGTQVKILKEEAKKATSDATTAANTADASQYAKHTAYNDMVKRANEGELLARQASQTTAQDQWIKTQSQGASYDNQLKAADAAFYGTEFGQRMRATERFLDSVGGLGRISVGAPRPKGKGSTNRTIHQHYREPGRAPRE